MRTFNSSHAKITALLSIIGKGRSVTCVQAEAVANEAAMVVQLCVWPDGARRPDADFLFLHFAAHSSAISSCQHMQTPRCWVRATKTAFASPVSSCCTALVLPLQQQVWKLEAGEEKLYSFTSNLLLSRRLLLSHLKSGRTSVFSPEIKSDLDLFMIRHPGGSCDNQLLSHARARAHTVLPPALTA